MTFDHDQAAAWLQRERDLAARGVKRGRERKPAAQPPGHVLTDLDRRLLHALADHQGSGGIYPTMGRLAELVGRSPRHVRRRLAVLQDAGLVERVAVRELPSDAEWRRRRQQSRGPGRQTSNSYRLGADVRGAPDTAFPEAAAQPPGHDTGDVRPRSVSEASTVSRDTIGAASLEPIEFPVEPPAALQLADDPKQSEIVATLERGFGGVQVEQVYPNQLAGSLAAFHQAADRLDRATCWGSGDVCQPGQRCRRHTRRKPS